MTSAGEETEISAQGHRGELGGGTGSLFMSMEVLAMARKRSGLFCEMSDPTRRPLAQKLRVRFLALISL